jgi:hypothetical protein
LLLPASRGDAQRLAQADVGRHDGVDEGIERVVAEDRQHRRLVVGRRAYVSFVE